MYLPHPYELLSTACVQRYLDAARAALAGFYELAAPADAVLMDRLMVTRAVLLIGVRADRDRLGPGRVRFEKALDDTEREFMELQLLVRTSPTFAALPPMEQVEIERLTFAVGSSLSV